MKVKKYNSPAYLLRNELLDSWREEHKKVVGRLFTLIEATFTDLEQRKAFKDVVSEIIYSLNSKMDYILREIVIDFIYKYMPNDEALKDESPFTGLEPKNRKRRFH